MFRLDLEGSPVFSVCEKIGQCGGLDRPEGSPVAPDHAEKDEKYRKRQEGDDHKIPDQIGLGAIAEQVGWEQSQQHPVIDAQEVITEYQRFFAAALEMRYAGALLLNIILYLFLKLVVLFCY